MPKGGPNEGTLLFDPSLGFGNLPFIQSGALNRATYQDYFMRLSLLAMSMYEWHNLPETCNERFLEETLYWYGQAIFLERKLGDNDIYGVNEFNEGLETGDIINLQVTPAGRPTIYRNYASYNAYSYAFNQRVSNENSVFVRNNYFRFPTAYTIRLYAQRFYEIERTCDVNIKSQKTPIIILTDEKNRLTWKNIYAKYDGNEPLIVADKTLNVDNFKSFPVAGPLIANDLMLYKHNLWNECMTFLGIKNTNTDKKERLVANEAMASYDQVNQSAEVGLITRNEAAEKMNQIWADKLEAEVYVTMRNEAIEPDFSSPEEVIKSDTNVVYHGTQKESDNNE